jgi:hypothetical protein
VAVRVFESMRFVQMAEDFLVETRKKLMVEVEQRATVVAQALTR